MTDIQTDLVEEVVTQAVPAYRKAVQAIWTPRTRIAGALVLTAAVSAYAGYEFARRKLETKYSQLAQDEIAEAREHYSKVGPYQAFATVSDAAAALLPGEEEPTDEDLAAYEALKASRNYSKPVATVVSVETDEDGVTVVGKLLDDAEVVQNNIFVNNQPINADDWDYDLELEQRTEDAPYIIHEDEFNENEQDFIDVSLTYYAIDDVLTNEQDEIVEDVEQLVGQRNLKKFGHGSQDKNMLYVRNNKRGLNIEIARSNRKYSVEVLGLDDDDAPDTMKNRRKIRGDGEG